MILVAAGFIFGRENERAHLARREQVFAQIIVSSERFILSDTVYDNALVMGSVVAQDCFQLTIGQILQIFGGNLRLFESLVERSRREALLCAKECAMGLGRNRLMARALRHWWCRAAELRRWYMGRRCGSGGADYRSGRAS